ncbi:MAG: hypothetical protein GY850_18390 [bacterium]|nr:hypothetical protein [bacterium]
MVNKHYVMIIDQERCIGCEACTVACRKENKGAQGYICVSTLGAVRKDTPLGLFPNLKMFFFYLPCATIANIHPVRMHARWRRLPKKIMAL